jgi:hypothetical protein
MRSRAFRNPTIYKKLVEFVDVDERKGVSRGVWEWEEGESKMWNATRIGWSLSLSGVLAPVSAFSI